LDAGGHHPAAAYGVEDLPSVPGPDRTPAAIVGNLPFPARTREGLDIDFGSPRLVGVIGDPAAVGGEGGAPFRESGLEKGLRLGHPLPRQGPDIAVGGSA